MLYLCVFSLNRLICRGSHGVAKGKDRYRAAGDLRGRGRLEIDILITVSKCDPQKLISFLCFWHQIFDTTWWLRNTPSAPSSAVGPSGCKATFGGKSMEPLMSPINLSGAAIFCHCFTLLLHFLNCLYMFYMFFAFFTWLPFVLHFLDISFTCSLHLFTCSLHVLHVLYTCLTLD